MHFTSFILGSALLFILSLAQYAQARGDFTHSCFRGLTIEETGALQGSCKDESGKQVRSSLDLNKCIGIGEDALIYELEYAGPTFISIAYLGDNANHNHRVLSGNFARNGCTKCVIQNGIVLKCQ